MRRRLFHLICLLPLLILVAVAMLLAAVDVWIRSSTGDRVFHSTEAVPAREYALVLGTSAQIGEGRPNLFFVHRMDAAADLFHAGKVRRLILSGGSEPEGHSEPEQMRLALIERGVPAESLLLDPSGYRTLDSVVRAREVFGVRELTIVSQEFHNQRALFIADRRDVDSVSFAAREVAGMGGAKVNLREMFARLKAVLDLYLLDKQPADLEAPGRPQVDQLRPQRPLGENITFSLANLLILRQL